MTQRIRTWQSALDQCVSARLHARFQWGANDCCLFAADCVHAVTGEDPASDLRGTYSTELQAARVLQRLGGVAEIAFRRLGPVVRTEAAQVGDVGLTHLDGRYALAVCLGGHWLQPGADGLVTILPAQVLRAWRVTR